MTNETRRDSDGQPIDPAELRAKTQSVVNKTADPQGLSVTRITEEMAIKNQHYAGSDFDDTDTLPPGTI